jgi:hypothetical protein
MDILDRFAAIKRAKTSCVTIRLFLFTWGCAHVEMATSCVFSSSMMCLLFVWCRRHCDRCLR